MNCFLALHFLNKHVIGGDIPCYILVHIINTKKPTIKAKRGGIYIYQTRQNLYNNCCLGWFQPKTVWALWLWRTPPRKGIVTIFEDGFRHLSSPLDWSVQTLIPDLIVERRVMIWRIVAIIRTVATDVRGQQGVVVSTEILISSP